MANVIFNAFKKAQWDGVFDLVNDTIKVMLVTSSYTPDQDAHAFIDDVTNEVSGDGYTAGGQALAGKSNTQDNTNNRTVFDADNPVWADSSITARGCVLYKDTGTPSTSPVMMYYDFTEDKVSNNGPFEIDWDAVGIAYNG